jgi:CheY-like chemotaxis protein
MRRILVADDDRLSRLLTQNLFEKLGFEVVVVGGGQAAVDAATGGDFDAIIMDCQMPGVDGFQATAAIRRQQGERHQPSTPIIGLSVRAMEGDADVAIARGMNAYITKPVSVRKVSTALAQVWSDGGNLLV